MATHSSGSAIYAVHADKQLKQKQQEQVHRTILIPPLPPPSQQQKQPPKTNNIPQDPKAGPSSTQAPKAKPAPVSTRKSKRPLRPTAEDVEARPHQDANEDDQDLVKVETYSDYKPAKVLIGRPHPDPVVETSSLATVEPPDIHYELKLPDRVMDKALLSSLQLESVIYASQQHLQMTPDNKTRRGFLIGDGAGVGKGRTVAGIIYENYLNGRKKSIWLSVSADLRVDAERDLNDIGAHIPVFLLGKFTYGKEIRESRGVVFTTYSGLVSQSKSVQGPNGSRLGQLISWVGRDFDGVIVFDECHKAKNITMGGDDGKKKVTKAAEYVVKLQAELPNARIVYASATGASETRHLGYMTRLGLWGRCTGYPTFADFCRGIESRGVSAMELVAVELKKRGSYIARQLSFKTTSFAIVRAVLTSDNVQLYDDCVDMWMLAFRHFREAESYIEDKRQRRSWWGAFWGAHQRFFKYLCISIKVPLVVEIAKQAIEDRKCVVIGLQSTGEAKTQEAMLSCNADEFISTAGATFESLIDNNFPAPPIDKRLRMRESSRDSSTIDLSSTVNSSHFDESDPLADLTTNLNALKIDHPNFDPNKRLMQMQKELYAKIDKLAPRLPENTLDDLIHKLGGPDKVAEMTGRKGRLVKDSKGRVRYQARNEVDASDVLNIREKERFMDGEKLIAIISEAASSGVSLQADRRVANQRRRVHITIELPWSADRAIQQFGRTHRSNQVSGPEYVFVISDLAGEIRFASIVAKRLESLGALTHGDRRAATEQRDISEFNISPTYCRRGLEYVNEVINDKVPYYFDNIKPNYPGDFIEDTRAAYIGVGLGSWQGANSGVEFTPDPKLSLELNSFLNRILGMRVSLQNALFDLFSRFVDRLILLDKRAGQYERGILEVNPESGKIRIDSAEDLSIRTNEGIVQCRLRNIEVDRGISWERASYMYELDDSDDRRSGFYQSNYSEKVQLAILEGPNQFRVHAPNVGTYSEYFNYGRIRERMHPINVKKAEKLWRFMYDATGKHCTHLLYSSRCRTTEYGTRCDTGMRIRYFSILSGAILTTLPYLSKKVPEAFKSLDIIRLRLDENTREIGPYIQRNVEEVRDALMEAQEKGIFWDKDSTKPKSDIALI